MLLASGAKNPFIFTAFAAREEGPKKGKPQSGPAEWVCGETASVEILIQNPTSVTLRVRSCLKSAWVMFSFTVVHANKTPCMHVQIICSETLMSVIRCWNAVSLQHRLRTYLYTSTTRVSTLRAVILPFVFLH